MQLEKEKTLRGQPGIESITKQYLYEMAYRDFLENHNIAIVKNCFLMPTAEENIISKGCATLPMLQKLGLQDIQIRLLPAKEMFLNYINNKKFDIKRLEL